MNIKSYIFKYGVISVILTFVFACTNPKEPLVNEFRELQKVVIAGDLEKFEDFLDKASYDFVQEMSQAENMKPDKLREIGKKYDLPLWCAEFYKYHSDHILEEPGSTTFFRYISMSETPLYDYNSDFELMEEKTRIGEENFVAIAKYSGKYRYINWLQYSNQEGSYKLNLLYLLKLEESRSWTIEKTNAEYIHGKTLPADWREEAVETYYKTAKVLRPLKNHNFDKRQRAIDSEIENGN